MSVWNLIDNKTPDFYEHVIVVDNNANMYIAFYDGDDFLDDHVNTEIGNEIISNVRAWTSIPKWDVEIGDEEGCEMEMELGNLLWGNSRGKYHIDRHPWQDVMVDILNYLHCDSYGFFKDEIDARYANDRCGINTEHFIVRPYYWGDDEDIAELPNFEYRCGDTYITIDWYKYPLRDSYSNVEISNDMWKEMVNMAKEDGKHVFLKQSI